METRRKLSASQVPESFFGMKRHGCESLGAPTVVETAAYPPRRTSTREQNVPHIAPERPSQVRVTGGPRDESVLFGVFGVQSYERTFRVSIFAVVLHVALLSTALYKVCVRIMPRFLAAARCVLPRRVW